MSELLVDLDAPPFVPEGLKVVEHQKGGTFPWDPSKISLYTPYRTPAMKWTGGSILRNELKGRSVCNANVFDFMFNTHRIQSEWMGRRIFCWGTIYSDLSEKHLCIRCLYWDEIWHSALEWLGPDWGGDGAILVPRNFWS